MGTRHVVLGYVLVVKPYRKHGNGAKGGGRKGSSGKRCTLYKLDASGKRKFVADTEGPNAKTALRELKSLTAVIPSHVAINNNGETTF
jgi:hypothetical protein